MSVTRQKSGFVKEGTTDEEGQQRTGRERSEIHFLRPSDRRPSHLLPPRRFGSGKSDDDFFSKKKIIIYIC